MNKHKFWLGINIYHEGRGEILEGQIAIGHVCLNRAIERHKSVTSIVLSPMQFSWHNDKKLPPIKNYEALSDCFAVAEMVIEQRLEGKNLHGADHYFNPKKASPLWAERMTFICDIGHHRFYKDD